MITLAEVLIKSGWTQDQINALDAKAMSGLTSYVTGVETAAEQKHKEAQEVAAKAAQEKKAADDALAAAKAAQEESEYNKRGVDEFWEKTYRPGIAAAEEEKQRLGRLAAAAEAKVSYFQTREAKLKELGLLTDEALPFNPPTAPPEPVKTPGTPTMLDPNELIGRASQGFNTILNIDWKYRTLYGKPLPMSPVEILAKAEQLKLTPDQYAERTFEFSKKESENAAAARKAEIDAATAAAVAAKEAEHKAAIEKLQTEFNAKTKTLAEQHSSNPDVNTPPGSAKFSEIKRQVETGERKSPLGMSAEERRKMTRENIHKTIEAREQQVA